MIVFDRPEELRPWTWAAAVAAAVLIYCMNFMSVFAVRAAVDPQRMTARGFAEALRQSVRCRRAYDRAAVREIPLLLLSLATVGVLFLFHTLPLWGTERYLLDLSPDYTTK